MAQQTIYRKVGDEFEPIGEYDPEWSDFNPYGIHMVVANKGSRMFRYNVDPEFAGLYGAGLLCKDELVSAIIESTRARPNKPPVTDRARELWADLEQELGGLFFLQYSSASDIAESMIKTLRDQFIETVADPGAREAFEKFLTIAYLTKE